MKIAVLGAGISGLACARQLYANGAQVVIFEKSRSLGGRCATRRWNEHVVDHGAQYFTLRDPTFRRELEALCGEKLRLLAAPVVDETGQPLAGASPRYYHAEGNNRLGKALLGTIPIRLETLIDLLLPGLHGWTVAGETFDRVVLSLPWPQAAPLLGLPPVPDSFAPCLTAFFAYRGEWAGDSAARYALSDHGGSALAWSACENHKEGRIRPGETVFVVQASPAFSREQLEADPAAWADRLREELEARWHLSAADRLEQFTHRWRYARPLQPLDPATLTLPRGLHLCGDSYGEARVEGAWLSGRECARAVLE